MNSRNRHTILLVAFAVVALLSFFFSPWEERAKAVLLEEFPQLTIDDNPMMIIMTRILLFGIMDAMEMVGYSIETIRLETEVGNLAVFLLPIITVVIYYVGQIAMNQVDVYYEDNVLFDSWWEKCFDLFCVENILTWALSLTNYLIVNVIKNQINNLYTSNEALTTALGIAAMVLSIFVVTSAVVYFSLYMLLIMLPIFILAVPFLNNMIGLIIFCGVEIICIFVVWRMYVADYALKYSFVAAKKIMSLFWWPFRNDDYE